VRLCVLLCLIAFAVPLAAQNECNLPPSLNSAIERQWRGWHVLRIADLTSEDQNLWTYARGRVCPGASKGHFLDAQTFAYAIAVVRGKQESVLVAPESASKWLLSVVTPPTRVGRFRVIWLAKPGTYTDKLTGRKTQAFRDAIGFEEIGAGVTVFIRQKNRFVPVRVGE
jgi:hypothetical protein